MGVPDTVAWCLSLHAAAPGEAAHVCVWTPQTPEDRNGPPAAPAAVQSLSGSSSRFLRSGRAFQLRDPGFNVFDLDGLGRVVEDAICSPNASGGRCILVYHDLQQRGRCSAGSLLEAGDGLTESLPTSVAVRFLELWLLHPAQQSVRANSDTFCSFLNIALREQGRNMDWPKACLRASVGFLKFWLFHPSQQGVRGNSDAFRSFLNIALREQGRNGLFLLTVKFGAVAYH